MTWNELAGCMATLPLLDVGGFHQVFALDGGSTDGTVEYLEQSGIQVVQQTSKGYNAAYREALEFYSGDAIIFFHPKGTIDLVSLDEMQNLLRQGLSLVIASRMSPGARNEEDDHFFRHRKWFGKALAYLSAIRWESSIEDRITDPLHGFRGCDRAFTACLKLRPKGATADLEMVRHAYVTGLAFAEFPVQETERPVGKSHFPAISTGWELLRYILTNR